MVEDLSNPAVLANLDHNLDESRLRLSMYWFSQAIHHPEYNIIRYAIMDAGDNEYVSHIPRLRYVLWHHYNLDTSNLSHVQLEYVQLQVNHIYSYESGEDSRD